MTPQLLDEWLIARVQENHEKLGREIDDAIDDILNKKSKLSKEDIARINEMIHAIDPSMTLGSGDPPPPETTREGSLYIRLSNEICE